MAAKSMDTPISALEASAALSHRGKQPQTKRLRHVDSRQDFIEKPIPGPTRNVQRRQNKEKKKG